MGGNKCCSTRFTTFNKPRVSYLEVCVCVCVCVQLSEDELSQLQKESWENPAFDNMDQLMDERHVHL